MTTRVSETKKRTAYQRRGVSVWKGDHGEINKRSFKSKCTYDTEVKAGDSDREGIP